jgi:deoxyadenosine/deoxycytidine kinase
MIMRNSEFYHKRQVYGFRLQVYHTCNKMLKGVYVYFYLFFK